MDRLIRIQFRISQSGDDFAERAASPAGECQMARSRLPRRPQASPKSGHVVHTKNFIPWLLATVTLDEVPAFIGSDANACCQLSFGPVNGAGEQPAVLESGKRRTCGSGRDSFVAMVKATNLRSLYDSAHCHRLDRPRDRSILVQGQV